MPLPPRVGKRRKQQNGKLPQLMPRLDANSGDAAFAALVTAAECGSKDVDVYLKLSTCLFEKHQYPEALAVCHQGLAVCGVHPALLGNQGAVLHLLGRYEEALDSVKQQASMVSSRQQPWNNLGNIYCNLGNIQESVRCFQNAIQLDGQDKTAHYNLAQALLLGGDYENGFREYEWRPVLDNGLRCTQPRWDGSPLQGRRILLSQEGGMGDAIQFVRYAPLVREMGGEVLLGVAPTLKRFLEWMRGGFAITPTASVPFDFYSPMMSLPYFCHTGSESIPPSPQFDIPQDYKAKWAQRLGNSRLPKIGLVWSGSPTHQNDYNRSAGLKALLPILQCENVLFFSLQVGHDANAIVREGVSERITDLSPYLTEYAETAAAVSQLDLVITVDTSVAHLCGTLGVPTWVMVPFAPEWRWLMNRSDSPWYPSIRLFRQNKMGNWPGVVQEILATLPEFLSRKKIASEPVILSVREDGCARLVADCIPAGANVLDLVCGKQVLEQFLPAGCMYLPCDTAQHDERTLVCDWRAGKVPSAHQATHITMLGTLEYSFDWKNLLHHIRALQLPLVLTYSPADFNLQQQNEQSERLNHLSLEELCVGLLEAGFHLQTSVRVDEHQILLRAVPEGHRMQTKRRILVLSGNSQNHFGDLLGLHILNSLLPAEAEIHYACYGTHHLSQQNYDLLILGTGGSLPETMITEDLLSLVRNVPRSVGIFGTECRERINRPLLQQILNELTVWFARYEEDLLLYGKGRQNALLLGDWLLNAMPMARWTKDVISKVDKATGCDLPPSHAIQHIQQYRQVTSPCVAAFLCALTSAEQVAYTEEREFNTPASGLFRSLLLDIFGRTWPESEAFMVDRAAVAGYRARVMKITAGMPQLFTTLLGIGA